MRDPRDQPPADPRKARREEFLIHFEAWLLAGIIVAALIASFVLPG